MFPVRRTSKENCPLHCLTAFPHMHRATRLLGRDSAVGIVNSAGAGPFTIPEGTRDFYLLQNVYIYSGAQPAPSQQVPHFFSRGAAAVV
jgi:hypothetical protein